MRVYGYPPKVRKIIQISTSMTSSMFMTELFVYALCDDGTVWVRRPWSKKEDRSWSRIEDIPQS